MNQKIRDMLAEEMGYTMCPIRDGYTTCDKNCEECEDYRDFVDCIEYWDRK